MDAQTIKHLELIQGVVDRLANNSFAFKAWAIVLVAAVFAFAAGDPCACDIDPDPACNIFDFLCFQTAFAAGCP